VASDSAAALAATQAVWPPPLGAASTDELTSAERVRRLLAGEAIDRVPVNAFASAYAGIISGVSFEEYYLKPEVALRAQQWAGALHGWDGTPAYAMPAWGTWDFGGEIAFPSTPEGGFPFASRHVAETPAEVEALTPPDPETAPATSRTLKFARLGWEQGIAPSVTGGSPIFEAVQMVGTDNLMRWFRREPDTVDRLLTLITDYVLAIADIFVDEFGPENISVFEAFPTESHAFVSPKVFERFTLPHEVRIHEHLLARGVDTWVIHLCGDHRQNLSLWRDAVPLPGRPVISIGGEMDLVEVGHVFGENSIVGGNVSTTLLQTGAPDEVVEASRACIERGLQHPGGFVLMPACGLPPFARPANVHAMIHAARTYGRYE
jgi:uroporphyrinogen decarboxylase